MAMNNSAGSSSDASSGSNPGTSSGANPGITPDGEYPPCSS